MHKLALLLVFVVAVSIIVGIEPTFAAESSENTWVKKSPMQQARSDLGVAAVNGKIYAIGGSTTQYSYRWSIPENRTGGIVGTNEEYDPATDTWTYKTSMPTPRSSFAIAVCQNRIYCIGGYVRGPPSETYNSGFVSIPTGANEVYDPATDTWKTKTPSPIPRAFSEANVVDGKIYITCGDTNGTINEIYDPNTDTWSTATPNPISANGYSSTVIDNQIYYLGGFSNSGGAFHQVYDPTTDTWSQKDPPPLGLAYGVAAATSGVNAHKRVYILHMDYNSPNLAIANSVYNPANGVWSYGTSAPTGRQLGFGVAVINDTLYLIGGRIDSLSPIYGTGTLTQFATNEMYIPFRYRNPDLSSIAPTAAPSTQTSPTTTQPTPAPTDAPPNRQVEPAQTALYAIGLGAAALVVVGLIVYFKKHRHRTIFRKNVRLKLYSVTRNSSQKRKRVFRSLWFLWLLCH